MKNLTDRQNHRKILITVVSKTLQAINNSIKAKMIIAEKSFVNIKSNTRINN